MDVSSGKEVGLLPEIDSHLKWKAARLFCSILGSLFVIKSTLFCDCTVCFCSSISRLSYVSQDEKHNDNNIKIVRPIINRPYVAS
ncbi:hypothetical protein TNCV_293971 [Trichonephila clavipes]|nr:hypothetical protein TNCV_293971 [Trichonephila clavipes]